MAKIVVSQFVTVDGVMEDPGGSEGWDRGGWAFKFERGPEGDQFKLDEVMASDALLLGRVTYGGFAEAWPSRSGDFADKFNGMRKYVVSSSMETADWSNSVLVKPDELGARPDAVEGVDHGRLEDQPGVGGPLETLLGRRRPVGQLGLDPSDRRELDHYASRTGS